MFRPFRFDIMDLVSRETIVSGSWHRTQRGTRGRVATNMFPCVAGGTGVPRSRELSMFRKLRKIPGHDYSRGTCYIA